MIAVVQGVAVVGRVTAKSIFKCRLSLALITTNRSRLPVTAALEGFQNRACKAYEGAVALRRKHL